jgi:VRR-NUC domain
MTRRRTPEADIQRCVFQHLRLRAPKDAFYFHPFSGGARRPIEAAIYKSLGAIAGLPDVIVIHRSRVFCLELKSTTGKLSETQRTTHDRMRASGALVEVAHGIDQALEQLTGWGLLRGTTT